MTEADEARAGTPPYDLAPADVEAAPEAMVAAWAAVVPEDLVATLGNVAVLSANTPLGLPYPVSSDPANQGANAIKALALAVDNKLTLDPVTQVVPQTNLVQGANNSWNLTTIPIARLVAFSGSVVMRMAQAQYTVVQIFDGTTNVAGDMAFSSPATGGAVNILGSVSVIGYKFVNVPVLKVFSSNTGQSMDAITFRGLAWR